MAVGFCVTLFQNYYHPYLFRFLFGTIGLLLGILAITLFNMFIKISYDDPTFLILAGMAGSVILLATLFNIDTTCMSVCDKYKLVDKTFYKGGYREPDLNTLYVKINDKTIALLSSQRFWEKQEIGTLIIICVFEGKLGFNSYDLADDK